MFEKVFCLFFPFWVERATKTTTQWLKIKNYDLSVQRQFMQSHVILLCVFVCQRLFVSGTWYTTFHLIESFNSIETYSSKNLKQ